ncbi:hypothetical protein KKF04_04525 [Patescibacteria group bacterium]|nr:hypothetical protein [Patescibacteria group bacterium]MBU1935295.1 hypothetical protein [Patescibacteria group bacterium]
MLLILLGAVVGLLGVCEAHGEDEPDTSVVAEHDEASQTSPSETPPQTNSDHPLWLRAIWGVSALGFVMILMFVLFKDLD